MGKGKAVAAATFSCVNFFWWAEAAAQGLRFPSRVHSRIRNYTNLTRIEAMLIRCYCCSYYIYIIIYYKYIFDAEKGDALRNEFNDRQMQMNL